MSVALPNRLRSYKVSASSPTDELLALGQVYAGVGDYAASFIDSEHLSVAKFCSTRLKKMVPLLIERKAIASEDDLYEMTDVEVEQKGFDSMTIDELYKLYRRWPLRHKARVAEGREYFTFFYEGRIVAELRKRKAANKTEQFKIDYCTLTYENELENMSFVLDVSVSIDSDKFNFDPERNYTPAELTALIKLYANYRSVAERELLVEYVDYALDHIKNIGDKSSALILATEIAELGRKKIIAIPAWLTDFIAEAIADVPDCEKVLPMLTLALLRKDQSLERKAQRIINRCYKECLATPTIATLYTSIKCSDYVTRFSLCKMSSVWSTLCESLLTIEARTSDLVKLLETAHELAPYTQISTELLSALTQLLDNRASHRDLEAEVTLQALPTKRMNCKKVV